MRQFLTCLLFVVATSALLAQEQKIYSPDWASLDTRSTPEWWQDAKFGIFIHWGVYSVPAFTPKGRYAEWYQHSLLENDPDGKLKAFHTANYGNKSYYELIDYFTASQFDPDAWAQLFENAGAKYVVITSKHHDGFCLWPSADANRSWGGTWNAFERGPKRDLLGELTTALRKTEVRPGFYYSLYEWYNPIWKADKAKYAAEHMIPQLHDLVNKYQPDILWGDGDWEAHSDVFKTKEFLTWLYNEAPNRDRVVVNDRWGSEVRFNHGGTYTPEYQPDMDFEDHDWEESRGMGFSYGYNRAEDAWDYNSSQTLILHLVDKVSRGGNFLLDIGPDAYGQIPPIMQERLLDIGQWLALNGEAIYGTRRWRQPCQWSGGRRDFDDAKVDGWKTGGDALLKQTIDPDPGFAVKESFFTFSNKTRSLYAILPQYPAVGDRKLVLRNMTLPNNTEVTLLATKERLRWENTSGNTVTITFPEYNPRKLKGTEAFVVKLGGFGAFTANPKIDVVYEPASMRPNVTISALPGTNIRYTTDGSEPNTSSKLYTEPFSVEKNTKIRARAYRPGLLESNDASADAYLYALMPALTFMQPPAPGLIGYLREAEKYTAANVEAAPNAAAGITYNFALDPKCAGACGMLWQGYINIDQTGGYVFSTNSDDGSKLYIDGQVVVDNDGDHGMKEKRGTAFLQRGWHSIKVVYFNSSGNGGLDVKMGKVGESLQEISVGALAH
jgi:alpha-L-fucosidase